VRLVQFKIYDVPAGGSPVWAGELHRTTVNGGLVNVILGSKTPFNGVDLDKQLYLEITVDVSGPTGQPDNAITLADPPMLPRQVILPVIFAKEAADSRLLSGFNWNAVFGEGSTNPATAKFAGNRIINDSITSNKLAPGAVTEDKIANGAVSSGKILDGALLDRHIGTQSRLTTPDGAISNAVQVDLAGNVGIGRTNPLGKLDVEGRILRKGQEFSKAGTIGNQGIVQVPWGTTNDWNIFVSPRSIGYIEGANESDNALLYFECFAAPNDATSWRITVRSRFRFAASDAAVGWYDNDANYLLLPK
jgi:hypothetical protein